MNVHARLERFTKTTHSADDIVVPTAERIEDEINGMGNDWSATIEMRCDTGAIVISASNGRYAVMANANAGGDFFDLVGKPDDVGEVAFVHGGQPADHPARHMVARELVVEVAKTFLCDCGSFPPKGFLWERQGG